MLYSHENNDAALLFRIAAGDRRAWLALYDRYVGVLLALAQHTVGAGDDAEEVIHEVFLQIWKQATDYRPQDGTVRAWLILQTRRRALELILDVPEILDQIRPARFLPSDHGCSAQADRGVARHRSRLSRERAVTQQALATLQVEERELLEMAYFTAHSQDDMIQKMAQPAHALHHKLNHTFGKLRRALQTSRS